MFAATVTVIVLVLLGVVVFIARVGMKHDLSDAQHDPEHDT